MKTCTEIREHLSEYVDGVLDSITEGRIREHLLTCEGCRQELSSLEDVVEVLRSLESVKAPGDFLERVHERLEPRFSLGKLVATLFLPTRIKIPLGAAGVVAVAILVLTLWSPDHSTKKLARGPESSTELRMAEKLVKPGEAPLAERKPPQPPPVSDQEKTGKGEEERGIIELVLVLETGPSTKASGGKMAPRAALAPQKEERSREVEGSRMAPSEPEGVSPGISREARVGVHAVLSKVRDLIQRVQGRILSVEYDAEAQRARTIMAEIPSRNYFSFYEALSHLAPLQTPPPPFSGEAQGTVHVRIRLIAPR